MGVIGKRPVKLEVEYFQTCPCSAQVVKSLLLYWVLDRHLVGLSMGEGDLVCKANIL